MTNYEWLVQNGMNADDLQVEEIKDGFYLARFGTYEVATAKSLRTCYDYAVDWLFKQHALMLTDAEKTLLREMIPSFVGNYRYIASIIRISDHLSIHFKKEYNVPVRTIDYILPQDSPLMADIPEYKRLTTDDLGL